MGGDVDLTALKEGPSLVKVLLFREKPGLRDVGKIPKGRTRRNRVVPPLMS